jgi:short-subunit dehydrogenase
MDTLLITGGSEGIGFEIVKKLINSFEIINISRNLGKLKEFNKIRHISFDLSNIDNYFELSKIIKDFKVDILINNVGGGAHSKIQKITLDKLKKSLSLNLESAIFLSHLVSKNMIRNKKGQIINIASIHALNGNPNSSLYSASKFGLRGFSDALHKELKKHNIKVTAIYPDSVDTKLLPASFKYRNKILKPQDIADIVKFVVNLPPNVIIKDLTVVARDYI